MEKYVRIVRKETNAYEMTDNLDNNNSSWNADKSLSFDDMNELGCEVLNSKKSDSGPERKKRERSVVKLEDIVYNEFNATEAKDFADTQKAKYIKGEKFLYRQLEKPVIISKDGFSSLSDEIILGILKFLSYEDLKYVAQVNQRFRRLSNDESLWPRLDLCGKMLNPNSVACVMKRGVKVLRLKEATIKPPIWEKPVAQTLTNFYSKIELLDLSYCVATSEDLALLLSKCRSLRKLSLESCEVSADVCREIGKNTLLDTLNLAMANGLDSKGIGLICASCKRLQHVNLAWTKLTKECVNIFASAIGENLLSLNLSGLGFSVSDDSIIKLIKKNPRLIDLDISDCVDVSSSIIPEISEALPKIKSLAISRCYKINPKILIKSLDDMPSLISLTAFRVISCAEEKDLEAKYSMLRVNKDYYSTIARPTVGVRRTSIWLVRCRE